MIATTTDHSRTEHQIANVGVVAPSSPDPDPSTCETQLATVGSGDPIARLLAIRDSAVESKSNGIRPRATLVPTPTVLAPGSGAFDELRVFAECFADAQDVRIKVENRLRSGTIPADVAADVLASQVHAEKLIGKEMVRAFKKAAPDVYAWTKDTVGLGESTMARLLGTIGHPVIARPHHWERTDQSSIDDHEGLVGPSRVLVADEHYLRNVAKLWAYCGHGDPTRRKRKGMSQDDALALGSPQAKKLVWLLSVACIKQVGTGTDHVLPGNQSVIARRRSPYRDVYDARRLSTADRTHGTDCVRCGPSGNPAQVGTPWSDGHKHADATRIVGKMILKDLWLVARASC